MVKYDNMATSFWEPRPNTVTQFLLDVDTTSEKDTDLLISLILQRLVSCLNIRLGSDIIYMIYGHQECLGLHFLIYHLTDTSE